MTRLDLATRQEIAREVYGPMPAAALCIAVLRVAAVEDLIACHVKLPEVERITALIQRAQEARPLNHDQRVGSFMTLQPKGLDVGIRDRPVTLHQRSTPPRFRPLQPLPGRPPAGTTKGDPNGPLRR